MKDTVICQAQIEKFVRDIVNYFEYSDEYAIEVMIGEEELYIVRGLDENDDWECDPVNLFNNICEQIAFEFGVQNFKQVYHAARERFGRTFEVNFEEN